MAIEYVTDTGFVMIADPAPSDNVTTSEISVPAGTTLAAIVLSENTRNYSFSNTGSALTWTQQATTAGVAANAMAQVWTARSATAQAIQITVTLDSNNDVALIVYAYTGVDPTTPVGHVFVGFDNTVMVWTPTLWTTSQAGTMAVGGWVNYNAHPVDAVSDIATTFINGGDCSGASARKSTTSASAEVVTASITFNATNRTAGAWIELMPSGVSIEAPGIASGLTFGAPVVAGTQYLAPAGVPSAEALGAASLGLILTASGIPSATAFGSPMVSGLTIFAAGIPAGSLGLPVLMYAQSIGVGGIASGEAWGQPSLSVWSLVVPGGIDSAEAFGAHRVQFADPQTIVAVGVGSLVDLGEPDVRLLSQHVLIPPSIQEAPVSLDRLGMRYGIARGITIMQDRDGVWSMRRYPSQIDCESARHLYMGGRRHVLTLDEVDALTLAGYGPYIHLEVIT